MTLRLKSVVIGPEDWIFFYLVCHMLSDLEMCGSSHTYVLEMEEVRYLV